MPFASVLSAYCTALGCTNKEIAERCDISPSALTRYRKGERTPETESDTIENLARGIASIARERGVTGVPSEDIIRSTLEGELGGLSTLGMDFCSRFDALMSTLEIRNAEIARELHVSPSYVSRIRSGNRAPADRSGFAAVCARFAAERCKDQRVIPEELKQLLSSSGMSLDWLALDLGNMSHFIEVIIQWLMGNSITNSDVSAICKLFDMMENGEFSAALQKLNATEIPEQLTGLPPAQSDFFYKKEMRKAEILFFDTAARYGTKDVYLSTDMPLLDMALDEGFIEEYQEGVSRLLKTGCKIHVIHSVERPLVETIMAAGVWIPPMMTGQVTYDGLLGVSHRLFYHSNYVCDKCALAAEAVMDHQNDGRYFFTTEAEHVRYYRRKMDHIMSHTVPLVESFREDNAAQWRRFKKDDKVRKATGTMRRVCADQYKNLEIELYPGDCAVLYMKSEPKVHFVTRDPKMRYVISHVG